MHQIATKPNKINLKAAAIGNGCTGTPGQSVAHPGTCNLGGDFDEQHNVDLFYGHGFLATKDRNAIYKHCNFTCDAELKECQNKPGEECEKALRAMDNIGAYNIYNIYDTCGNGNMTPSAFQQAVEAPDSDVQTWSEHRSTLSSAASLSDLLGSDTPVRRPRGSADVEGGGGPPYSWKCGMGDATSTWMNNEAVRKAVHVNPQR